MFIRSFEFINKTTPPHVRVTVSGDSLEDSDITHYICDIGEDGDPAPGRGTFALGITPEMAKAVVAVLGDRKSSPLAGVASRFSLTAKTPLAEAMEKAMDAPDFTATRAAWEAAGHDTLLIPDAMPVGVLLNPSFVVPASV